MDIADFDFDLPASLIAQEPLPQRSGARLLCLDGETGQLHDTQVSRLVEWLNPGDVLIFNDTRVIPARLHGQKESGGKVEVLLERILDEQEGVFHVRASKSPKPGGRLLMEGGVELHVLGREGELFRLRLHDSTTSLLTALETHGHMPLPPYIEREDGGADRERYQTVFADRPGAVAAPTAGLHFDEQLLASIRSRGVETVRVTLHVGAGTFQPVRVNNIHEHVMHAEWGEVPQSTVDAIAAARARGGRVVAIGTTSVRALESAARFHAGKPLAAWQGDTRLFITPGVRFKVVDALLTNFHLPRSTLLMLISAFGGHENVMRAYRHAVAEGYRFFSYGDAMFITPAEHALEKFQ